MPKYWFRQKTFGYGARPNTWQGWTFTVVSCLAVFAIVLTGPAIRNNGLRAVWMVGGLTLVLVLTVAVAHAKTEGGWRWRNGQD